MFHFSHCLARRTGTYDVITAWKALLEAKDLKEILQNKRLQSARQEVNFEVEKHTHTPPKFSKDGKIAVLKINTTAQVHPVIATRWVCTSSFQVSETRTNSQTGRPSEVQSLGNRHVCQLRLPPREGKLLMSNRQMRKRSRYFCQYHRFTESSGGP